jgi:ATP-binding protein involved in chromosome partitioning
VAEGYGVPLLGSLPLDIRIREQTDGGRPTVIAEPAGPLAAIYIGIATRMKQELARVRAAQIAGPSITIVND